MFDRMDHSANSIILQRQSELFGVSYPIRYQMRFALGHTGLRYPPVRGIRPDRGMTVIVAQQVPARGDRVSISEDNSRCPDGSVLR